MDKNIKNEFILLKTEKGNTFSMGKIINITRKPVDISLKSKATFNGIVNIYSLSRILKINSLVTNGVIEAFHMREMPAGKQQVVPIIYPSETLPEVVVMAYLPPNEQSWSFNDWYNIQSLLSGNGTVGDSGDDGSNYGSTGGYYSTSNPDLPPKIDKVPYPLDPIFIDIEPVENLQPIDVLKYIKCFGNIPDEGATCTIKILSDIPVDSDPTVFLVQTLDLRDIRFCN